MIVAGGTSVLPASIYVHSSTVDIDGDYHYVVSALCNGDT